MDTLLQAAASFPSKVASCPQRTWAILTKYDTNAKFIAYADAEDIEVKDFASVTPYASDLLDQYMVYKNNLAILHRVLATPAAYRISSVAAHPIHVSVKALIEERKLMKAEMVKIIAQIDKL